MGVIWLYVGFGRDSTRRWGMGWLHLAGLFHLFEAQLSTHCYWLFAPKERMIQMCETHDVCL